MRILLALTIIGLQCLMSGDFHAQQSGVEHPLETFDGIPTILHVGIKDHNYFCTGSAGNGISVKKR